MGEGRKERMQNSSEEEGEWHSIRKWVKKLINILGILMVGSDPEYFALVQKNPGREVQIIPPDLELETGILDDFLKVKTSKVSYS